MKISLSTYIIPSARVFIKEQKLFFTSKIGNTLLSMKVRINPWRILPLLLGIMLLGAIIIFSFSFSLFLKPITQWEWPSYALIGLWVVMSAILIIVTFTTGYYEVFKKYVVVHRGTKKLIYYYSDVVYIDEKQYQKGKTIALAIQTAMSFPPLPPHHNRNNLLKLFEADVPWHKEASPYWLLHTN